MKKERKKYSKENFLSILSSLSIEEINDIIREKGKEPKLIIPFIIMKDNKNIQA